MKATAKLFIASLLSTTISFAEDDFADFDRDIPQSYSNVKVSVNNQFLLDPYSVEADTVYDLGRVLSQRAPNSTGGLQAISKLTLEVDWKINSRQAYNYCELFEVKIENNSIFTQPQWLHGNDVSESDLDKWENFLVAITQYQDLNKQVISRHLDKFASALRKIKPEKLCSELEESINLLGVKHLKNAGFELNALAQETANGSIIKDLEYPDFFSDKQDQNLADEQSETNEKKNSKK